MERGRSVYQSEFCDNPDNKRYRTTHKKPRAGIGAGRERIAIVVLLVESHFIEAGGIEFVGVEFVVAIEVGVEVVD